MASLKGKEELKKVSLVGMCAPLAAAAAVGWMGMGMPAVLLYDVILSCNGDGYSVPAKSNRFGDCRFKDAVG